MNMNYPYFERFLEDKGFFTDWITEKVYQEEVPQNIVDYVVGNAFERLKNAFLEDRSRDYVASISNQDIEISEKNRD